MLLCRLFHSVGAVYEKTQSPYVLVLLDGTSSSRIDDGPRSRTGFVFLIMSQRYLGAKSSSALKHSSRNLKSVLDFTGSQCSFFKTGVMWSYFFAPISRRAALF